MTFTPLEIRTGLLLDLTSEGSPTLVFGWSGGPLALPAGATHFGMVTAGEAIVRDEDDTFRLRMTFAIPDDAPVIIAHFSCEVIVRMS